MLKELHPLPAPAAMQQAPDGATSAVDCHNENCPSETKHGLSTRATADGMRNATFCLVLRGDTPTSRRLFDAIVAGCIPVIISDGKHFLPFEVSALDYRLFSVRISEDVCSSSCARCPWSTATRSCRRWTLCAPTSPMVTGASRLRRALDQAVRCSASWTSCAPLLPRLVGRCRQALRLVGLTAVRHHRRQTSEQRMHNDSNGRLVCRALMTQAFFAEGSTVRFTF